MVKLPEGKLAVTVPRRIKPNETISRVEAPRGELFYFIKSNGTEKPERVKVRTPSIMNFASIIALAPGHQLADMPMLLAGIDPCFSCNDRMVTVQQQSSSLALGVSRGDIQVWSWEDLRRYGINFYKKK